MRTMRFIWHQCPALVFAAALACAAASGTAANLNAHEQCKGAGLPAAAWAETPGGEAQLAAHSTVPGSGALSSSLEKFLRERAVDLDRLDVTGMVAVMSDWFRLVPAPDGALSDVLVFRYGGWSDGCATGFELSLLRRIDGCGGEGEQTAGITLLFEPARPSALAPASFVSTDSSSMEEFLVTIRESPAFRTLAQTRPMSAMTENALR